MSGNTCTTYPEVPGKGDSKLYKELLKKYKLDRSFVNYLYASYKASNMAALMDASPKNYKRNSQGEHNAADVLDFINWASIRDEISSLKQIEKQIGAVDANDNRIDYTNAREALEKAAAFNQQSKGLVAGVMQHGDVYNIMVYKRNSRTQAQIVTVEERLKVWDLYRQTFNTKGIDIENLPQEIRDIFNALNTNIVGDLQNIQRTQMKYITEKEALVLFFLDPNSAEVKRLQTAFGSIEAAAEALGEFNKGNRTLTTGQMTLLKRAVLKCMNFQNINLAFLENTVSQMTQQIRNAPDSEAAIKNELHKLNKKYNLDIDEIHRINNKINTLSEAAADAVFVLKRQIRELEEVRGNNTEGKRKEKILNQLMRELENKKYYSGILNFLGEATASQTEIDDLFIQVSQSNPDIQQIFKNARLLQQIDSIRKQYYPLISALANDSLIIDEAIGQTDIDNIRQSAKKLKEFYDKKFGTDYTDGVLDYYIKKTMEQLLTHIVGDTAPDGQVIENLIQMAAVDSNKMDFLYSVGRASNPIVAAMGSIIRTAQSERDEPMNKIALRIRRATELLYKSGSNTDFMYEDDGHIISDIDWDAFNNARDTQIKALYRQGLRGFDLKEAIEDWEDQNMEDRVVDTTNNRTEKVPNQFYRKPFPQLTAAQLKYYNTVMQIKGEIGSLLPNYAQHHYLPPQIRRSTLDAIARSKNSHDVVKALRNKAENFYKIREDDTNYHKKGIIEGNEYEFSRGDFDNVELRQIPIFFVNKVEKGELSKDFSYGLQALANTAINYSAMNSVVDTVELMRDFVINKQQARNKEAQADVVESKTLSVVKDLWKFGKNTNTAGLMEGFISQHIYGQKQLETGIMSKIWSNIIGYTSFKGLATNIKGAFSNYLVGEFQMLIEAGAGEFYGFKDYTWAHDKLFGGIGAAIFNGEKAFQGAGVAGELSELLTNNMNHKATLLREMFDPISDNFEDKGRQRYYKSMFRQLISHDCSFIGYASGEYLIHYVNMYAILHRTKVKLNGKTINLYDAFELTKRVDGNSELVLKQGVTTKDGQPITKEWLQDVKSTIKYVNDSTHGAMNIEDKGLIHQHWVGRGIMNFRQWMVEHYSRRFRKRHWDYALKQYREGYWQSMWKMFRSDDTADSWNDQKYGKAVAYFVRDMYTFAFRAQAEWSNLDESQQYNVKRVLTEMAMYAALLGLSFALGEPDEHKKQFWYRWWIYQVKRLMLDSEASMPVHPKMLTSSLTILQSPMAGVNTLNSVLYVFTGLLYGDIFKEIKSGEHKGENKYIRNVKKNVLPFFKDWEQMQRLDEDDSIFKVFEVTPTNK